MSDTDSFIEEVSEEVRRDKMYGYLRRYGWIGILLVVGIVGGAAYNEYNKASQRNAAQARGDAILAALDNNDASARQSALAAIEGDGRASAVVALLTSAEALAADDPSAASAALQDIIDDTSHSQIYRDMAVLKQAILNADGTSPADRIASLETLASPGGAFRVLAEEQIALAQIEAGETDAAITRLQGLLQDNEASASLRRRVTQLIVALGAEPDLG